MSILHLLPHRVDIYRKSSTDKNDDYGHAKSTWPTTATAASIPCRLEFLWDTSMYLSQTPSGQIKGDELVGIFEPDANIVEGDRVYWTKMSTWWYVRPFNPMAELAEDHHLEIVLGREET